MKKTNIMMSLLVVALFAFGVFAEKAIAGVWIMANGGSYFTQYGSEWHTISNDGYCVSGRGPCGSSLWYLQWSYNHGGCGYDEEAKWNMASVQDYNGSVYAWIDSSSGTMYGADYLITYNGASSHYSTVNQNSYIEAWAPVALGYYRISNLWLTDGWGTAYTCNSVTGKTVEFDEVKLEI